MYRRLYRLFNPIVMRQARGDEKQLRAIAPGQWQAEHFEDLPVLVIPCYRRGLKHRPTGHPQIAVASFYGSVYPARPESAAGLPGGGPGRVVADAADLVGARGTQDPRPAPGHHPGLHHPDRVGQRALRTHGAASDR